MADPRFQYVAVGPDGRRVKGVTIARDEPEAYESLKRDGLSPLSLRLQIKEPKAASSKPLSDREAAEVLSSLAELLLAGADIRTALSILGARFERPAVKQLCEALAADIGCGEPLDHAFAKGFDRKQTFVAPMVAAGLTAIMAAWAGGMAGGLWSIQ